MRKSTSDLKITQNKQTTKMYVKGILYGLSFQPRFINCIHQTAEEKQPQCSINHSAFLEGHEQLHHWQLIPSHDI